MTTSGQLSAYVPALVRRRLHAGLAELPHADDFEGAVLIADISGFTRMTEQIARRGPEGGETLTHLLNAYFGRLIDAVDTRGGEVMSFTGDGLIAVWPGLGDETDGAALHTATACGLELAQLRSEHPDAAEVTLNVRVGVSGGRLRALELGGLHGRRFTLLTGRPLDAASHASEAAVAGEVVVDSDCWPLLEPHARGEGVTRGAVRVDQVEPPPLGSRTPPPQNVPHELLAPYIPPPVISREGVGQGAWLAELRRVTVVLVNLPGVDHRADPGLVQQAVVGLQRDFDRHGATIASLTVDAKGTSVVAATGLPPLSHDDDPVRAVRAAMAVAASLDQAHWHAGVGVATGRALCGPVGNLLRREYTMAGDVVNTAARLMENALAEDQGSVQVLCDAPTERVTRQRIGWGAPQMLALKGKAGLVEAFAPMRRRDSMTSIGSGTVGRGEERLLLVTAAQRAAEGAHQLLVLEGEAGMGKTRLLVEALNEAESQGARCLTGSGDPIERVAPYHAWRTVFAAMLGADDTTDPEARGERALAALPEDVRPLAPLLNLILGTELPETDESARIQGERRTHVTRRILLDLLARWAEAPLLIAIDDGHWLDSASWALILECALRRLPLCLIMGTRPGAGMAPEYEELLAEPGTQRVSLAPLASAESVAIACQRLGVGAMPEPVAGLIVDKAAGNPLFTEELAYALRDSGLIEIDAGQCRVTAGRDVSTLALPDTVEGIIGSRIDRLEPQPELVLKVASAVGLTFAPDVVRDVFPLVADRDQIDQSLDTLVRRDLTVRVPPPPGISYSFRHPLTREVAYNRMLFSQRRELHRVLAEWYEEHFADNLEPVFATLAHHWTQAGDVDKACQYLGLASEQAFTHGMAREAADLGLHAAELLGEPLPRDREAIMARTGETLAEIAQRMESIGGVKGVARLPVAADERRVAAIGVMLRLEPPVFVSGQVDLFVLIGLRAFLLTLQYGATPFRPGAVAIYAMLVRAIEQDPEKAFAFSDLAVKLVEQDGPALQAYAGFVHHFFIKHWLAPIGPDLDDVLENARSGFAHGDVTFGSFNLACHAIHLAASGAPLQRVIDAAGAASAEIAGRTLQGAFHTVHEMQIAKALAGRTIDRTSLTDRTEEGNVEEERDLASITRTDLHEQIGYYWTSKLRLHYLYRDHRRAVAFGERAEKVLEAFAGEELETEFVFLFSLALLARFEDTGDATSRERAQALAARVRGWEQHAPRVFSHKVLALDGAEARADGDHERAAERFAAAASAAEEIGFIHHVALMLELAGHSLVVAGDAAGARERLTSARAAYEQWGATAKVADVDQALAELGA